MSGSRISITAEAWALLWMCRSGLWFASFPRVLRSAQWAATRLHAGGAAEKAGLRVAGLAPDEAARAIERALPWTWRASCLTQALAGWILLERHHTHARLKIGVARPDADKLAAHAWLECADRIIVGDSGGGIEPFDVIWSLPPENGLPE